MIGYTILCPEDTTWAMSPEYFTDQLETRWPGGVQVRPVETAGVALRWDVSDDDEDVELMGHFDKDGLTVGLKGPSEGYATFACWYRSLVPFEVPLILVDDNFEEIYPLTAETTPDDILSGRAALQPPPDFEDLFTRTRKTNT